MAIEPGPQFMRLYRGLANREDAPIGNISDTNLGIHWTDKKDIAEHFAFNEELARDETGFGGVILEADVDPKHIEDLESDEGKALADKKAIMGKDSHEGEYTLKPDSPVNVLKIHRVSGTKDNVAKYETEDGFEGRT